ncbi:MAG: type II toxin-antitoxin system prevent-host-death family antitoxin [Acidobacteriota bacterium]
MLGTISIQEAQAHLSELITKLIPGEEIVITQNERPVAKLISQSKPLRRPRQPGSARGKLIIHSEDDEHLKDFEGYLS